MGVEGQPHAPAASTIEKDAAPIVQEAGWAPGPVWRGEKSRPHWDSIPDNPARSQSLYRLSYPADYSTLTVVSFILYNNIRKITGFNQGSTKLPNPLWPPLNSTRQKGDMAHILYCKPTSLYRAVFFYLSMCTDTHFCVYGNILQ